MISQNFFERYLAIQHQILDNKISVLKERAKDIKSDMVRDFRYNFLMLERRKNKILREYKAVKETQTRNYDLFASTLNTELQDLCKLYNNLFKQLESNK
ncbi:MAG TPA: hypothetical protein VD908_07470 [Cytophagales bacterium]|nr:hypothetical protein [Cytophagales bacterium]